MDTTKKRPVSFVLKHKSRSQVLINKLFPFNYIPFLSKLTLKHFIWDLCGQKTEDADHICYPTCTSPIFNQYNVERLANQTLYQISMDVYDNYHNTEDILTNPNPSSLHQCNNLITCNNITSDDRASTCLVHGHGPRWRSCLPAQPNQGFHVRSCQSYCPCHSIRSFCPC